MVSFSRLGHKGNLGNQLFQIASTIGIASRYGHDFYFPKWDFSVYFKKKIPIGLLPNDAVTLIEKEFSYHNWDLKENYNYDLNGWLQSEKYFEKVNIKEEYFSFKEDVLNSVKEKINVDFKNSILISVRRGDYVNNPNYYQLPYAYYFLALQYHFPDWQLRTVFFTSDDISYCKRHFSFMKNAVFVSDLSVIEQLALGKLCSDFIISNSTFSWWQAWLGEKKNSKIIRPLKYFRGSFEKEKNEKDFFPDRWIMFDHKTHSLSNKYFRLKLFANTERIWNYILFHKKRTINLHKKKIKNYLKYKKIKPEK